MSSGKRYNFNPPKLSRESSTAYGIPPQAPAPLATTKSTVSSGTPPKEMSQTEQGSSRRYYALPAINFVIIVLTLTAMLALIGLVVWNIILTNQLQSLIEAQPNGTCHLNVTKDCELTKSKVETLATNLSATIEDQQELKVTLHDLSTRHTSDIAELSRQVEDTQRQVRSIVDSLSSQETKIDNLLFTQQNVTSIVSTVLTDIDETRQSVIQVNASLNNLEFTVSTLRQITQANISLLSSDLATINGEVTIISQIQSSFNTSLMVLYEEATFNTSQLSGHIQTVNGHIRATNNSLNELTAKVTDSETRTENDISQLVDSYGQLQNQLGMTSGRLDLTNERLDGVETGQDTLGDRLDDLVVEGAEINTRLDSQGVRIGRLERDVDELQSSGDSVTSNVLILIVVSIITILLFLV